MTRYQRPTAVTPPPGPRKAAAAVEMAVVLPFVALLFMVAVDFCRVFHCTQTVQGCAQTAALYASGTAQPPPNSTASAAAQQAAVADGAVLDPPLQAGDVAIAGDGPTVTVTVTYRFQTFVPYPGRPQPLVIVRTAQLPVAPAVGQTK
jgi:Flp pilus assembly protein TadG